MKNVIIIMTLIMSLVLFSCNPREQRERSRQIVKSTIVEQQPVITPVMAATELIALKQSNIELDKLDSVFKTIPDEIIIFICNKEGLDLDTIDQYGLTRLYLSKKDYYDNIVDKYNKIEEFKGHNKIYKPDSIPTKAKLDSTLH